jgi:protein-S-isoprenylcysteine O-methyltransferase Ste14
MLLDILTIISIVIYSLFMIIKFKYKISTSIHVKCLHIIIVSYCIIIFAAMISNEWYLSRTGIISIPFFLAGIMLVFLSLKSLKLQTLGYSGNLVDKNIYSYVRNPMYLGIILIIIGVLFVAFSASLVFYIIMLMVGFKYIVIEEEKELKKSIGKKYLIYLKKVPRFIPGC